MIASKGKEITNWKPHLLFFYCCCGIVAGIVGGLLGLGGGFILGPLFLELGIPPQVHVAFQYILHLLLCFFFLFLYICTNNSVQVNQVFNLYTLTDGGNIKDNYVSLTLLWDVIIC